MNNQYAKPKINAQQLLLVAMVVALLISATIAGFYLKQSWDPYIREVLSLKGDVIKGNAIYQINCAGCHGIHGDGYVGPTLSHISRHKSDIGMINQVISGKTPPMPKFQPTPQEMADLLSYLKQL